MELNTDKLKQTAQECYSKFTSEFTYEDIVYISLHIQHLAIKAHQNQLDSLQKSLDSSSASLERTQMMIRKGITTIDEVS